MGGVQIEVEYVEVARARSERGEVVLRRRVEAGSDEGAPTVLELRVNGVFVMDSSENASEVAMARVALERCPTPRHSTPAPGPLTAAQTLYGFARDDQTGRPTPTQRRVIA